ncbi:unnamed protein product [Staurois parvus]|uniref:Secreted protein n=1 Tax=Staurois parvus TaxID=386267 RepID=A0ABN9DRZ9_9NEOB|nr:unnamed protein product [Staurois parvus]
MLLLHLLGGIPKCSSGQRFSATSGNPELHSGLPCGAAPGSVLLLPCPALPRCPSCCVPCNVLRRMPASVFWVPSPATSGCTGTERREI